MTELDVLRWRRGALRLAWMWSDTQKAAATKTATPRPHVISRTTKAPQCVIRGRVSQSSFRTRLKPVYSSSLRGAEGHSPSSSCLIHSDTMARTWAPSSHAINLPCLSHVIFFLIFYFVTWTLSSSFDDAIRHVARIS